MSEDVRSGPPRPIGLLPVLDLDHLAAQTLGDTALARELLVLFSRQCTRIRPVLSGEDGGMSPGDAAHTLKGAALAIGAGRVAACAEAAERAAARGRPSDFVSRDLILAMDEACAAIAALHPGEGAAGSKDAGLSLAKPDRLA